MYVSVKLCIKYDNTFSQFFDSHIGLKQGDPSSPILVMLFVNDMIESINSNLNGIFTTNEIKLFLILFADYQVVFAKSPQALQSILADIENYCTTWGIKINSNKTKAMIFEKGRRTHYDFFIYNTKVELVDSFKYLGITLFKNGNWYSDTNNSNRLKSYCLYKHNFNLEKYLKVVSENKYKVALSRFRTSSHDLRIETGRYDNIPQEQRLCNSCNMAKVEDEFHFLLVCPKYRDLRCKYFKRYFCHWPTIHKLETLMSSTSNKVLNSIAKYIYYALKTRIS